MSNMESQEIVEESNRLLAYMQSRIDAGVAPEALLMLLYMGFETGVTANANALSAEVLFKIAIDLEVLTKKVRKAATENRSAKRGLH